jgi:hypothetical protein
VKPQGDVLFIPLALWQSTARRVLAHASSAHHFAVPTGPFAVGRFAFAFTTGPATARVFHRVAHGKEHDMPIFGALHGYGIGQIDTPGNADHVGNLVENLKEAARRFMIAGGQGTMNRLGHEFTNPGAVLSQRSRGAVFHRQVVRAYNSGPGSTECIFDGGDWLIRPSIMSEPNIYYPDNVLSPGLVTPQVPYQDLLPNPQQRARSPANPLPNPPLNHLDFTNAHFPAGL